jgi:hypothetical protein
MALAATACGMTSVAPFTACNLFINVDPAEIRAPFGQRPTDE